MEPHVTVSALSTRGLDKSFGSLVVANNIEIDLPRGERYALITLPGRIPACSAALSFSNSARPRSPCPPSLKP
jgi:hypothetical protein